MNMEEDLVKCPLCNRYVSSLPSNGFCRNCPEYRKWLGYTGETRGRSKYKRTSNRPSGRSGKINTIIDNDYVDDQFYKKSGLSRAYESQI